MRHELAGGWAGPPGENGAECSCGVTFGGFDTHREATEMLDLHIASHRGVVRRARSWLHRRGLARVISTGTRSDRPGWETAYVETCLPWVWLARWTAVGALGEHHPWFYGGRVDGFTRHGWLRRRWHLSARR